MATLLRIATAAFALAQALVAPSAVAATTNGTVTLTGTVGAPATCEFSTVPIVNGNYVLPAGGAASYTVSSGGLNIKCTNGSTSTVRAPMDLNPLTLGSGSMTVRIRWNTTNIGTTPLTVSGTGAWKVVNFTYTFMGPNGGRLQSGINVGQISGTVPLTVSY